MSKEFQIRDGNLIASFDLENEDGDIDFCKLLKVSHGVADEIGMFVDYVATNKIIKDQSKQISDLEAKLAESEEAIKYLKGIKRYDIGEMLTENAKLKQQLAEKDKEITQRLVIQEKDYNQDKISFAVEQLEKVKEMLQPYLRFDINLYLQTIQNIDNQIKAIKGEK